MTDLNELIDRYLDKQGRSEDKETLLREEIQAHEILFNKYRVSPGFLTEARVTYITGYDFKSYVNIHKAYYKYIVHGEEPPAGPDEHYYNEARVRIQYLKWLKRGTKAPITILEEACRGGAYGKLKKWLIDNKLVNPVTLIWTDKKGALANYLKDLHVKGYTRRSLTNTEIKAIALNSFKTDISIDTIKKAPGNPPYMHELPPV